MNHIEKNYHAQLSITYILKCNDKNSFFALLKILNISKVAFNIKITLNYLACVSINALKYLIYTLTNLTNFFSHVDKFETLKKVKKVPETQYIIRMLTYFFTH